MASTAANSTAIAHILIVDDEPAVTQLLATTLQLSQFVVTVAQNAAQAQLVLNSTSIDAMVLDWMMPAMTGPAFVAQLRQQTAFRTLPILMLTAKAQEDDKIAGLDAGADDYLSKPFSPRELVARLKALLRRAQPLRDEASLVLGAVTLQPALGKAFCTQNSPIHASQKHSSNTSNTSNTPSTVELASKASEQAQLNLSQTEYKLLHCLMLRPQRVHSRESLLAQAWDHAAQVDVRTVDAHIKGLRQALAAAGCSDFIHTVRGMGYTLSPSA